MKGRPPRCATGLAVGLAALSAALPRAADGSDASAAAPPSWYAQVLARGPGGLNVTHFWSKGPWLRAETVVAGHKVVTIVNGPIYYAYDAVTRRGVAVERAPEAVARDAERPRPFGNEAQAVIEQGGEKVGEEELHGRACDVYRVTDSRGRRDVWVTRDALRLPVRMELFDRRRGETFYTDFVNWERGVLVSDAFFEPEPGVELERFGIEQYFREAVKSGRVGPVPILYAELLHGHLRN